MTACRWPCRWRANASAAGMAPTHRGAGRWRVAGRPVLPQRVERPSLVVVPAHDRIVPPRTAAALAERLPAAETPDARRSAISA